MGSKKIAFITGGARGLGFEIARQLGHKGYSVFIGARNPNNATEKVESLKGEGIEASYIELDVGHETSIERAIKEINKKTCSGKKIDFILQELFRESNTLSVKLDDPYLKNHALDMKLYIEEMREQIQNVE